jgi:hypothetical protein
MIKRKGINYYKTRMDAQKVADTCKGNPIVHFGELIAAKPRVVEYELGYAVQYCISGAYYPQLETQNNG